MKKLLTALAAIGLAGTGLSHASTIFVEDFEGSSVTGNWNVYDTWGSFVTVSGAGIEVQASGTVAATPWGNNYVELDSDFQVTANPGAGANTSMTAHTSRPA